MTINLLDCMECPPFSCADAKTNIKTAGTELASQLTTDDCGSLAGSSTQSILVRPTTTGLRTVFFNGVQADNLIDTGIDVTFNGFQWRRYTLTVPAGPICTGSTVTAEDVTGATLTLVGGFPCIGCTVDCLTQGTLQTFNPTILGDISITITWPAGSKPSMARIEYTTASGTTLVLKYCDAPLDSSSFSVCGQNVLSVSVRSEFGNAAFSEVAGC